MPEPTSLAKLQPREVLRGRMTCLSCTSYTGGGSRGSDRATATSTTQVQHVQINKTHSPYVPKTSGKQIVNSYTKYIYLWLSNLQYSPLVAGLGGLNAYIASLLTDYINSLLLNYLFYSFLYL